MSPSRPSRPWNAVVLFFFTLLWLTVCAYGQSYQWSTGFDTSNSVTGPFSLGPPIPTIVWDSTVDSSTNPTSGSVKIGGHFTGADNEIMLAPLTFLDASNKPVLLESSTFEKIAFDVRVEPGTAPSTNNSFGSLMLGFVTTNWQFMAVAVFPLPLSATNWARFEWDFFQHPISLGTVSALYFGVWSGGALTNTFAFNVDNIGLNPGICCPPPPPGPWLDPAIPGLNLTATGYGGENQSQNIITVGNSCSWVDAAGPVNYAVNIRRYPPLEPLDPSMHEKFETDIQLTPDYNYLGDVAMLQVLSDAFGGAIACFTYKTNSLGSDFMLTNLNPELGPVGTLATLSAPAPTGEWRLGFLHNTNVTITAPNGSTTNFLMPAAAAAHFGCPVRAQFGIRPNTRYNVQSFAVLSGVRITGTAGDIDETFSSGPLNTNLWEVSAADAAGIQVVPPEGGYWLTWRWGLEVQFTTNPGSGAWIDTGLQTNAVYMTPLWRVLRPKSTLLSTPAGFWRLRVK